MSLCNISIPQRFGVFPVDTRFNNLKVLLLPTVSTNVGSYLTFKDYYGTASNSTFNISTTGMDLIDDINNRYTFSNNYGSISFLSDGVRSWRTMGFYNGALSPSLLPLNPSLRYSFLPANYSGVSPVQNIGSDSSIGSGTVVANSYTSASPSFITNVQGSQYVLGSSIANLRTVIMICRIRGVAGFSYFLDGRPGMANGWILDNSFGSDWNGATYYRDCISLTLQLPDASADSQWHHFCLITASAYTSAMTFAARFNFVEGMGCDIAEIMIFTQALTLQQVKDNFNFFAPRFGWTPVA